MTLKIYNMINICLYLMTYRKRFFDMFRQRNPRKTMRQRISNMFRTRPINIVDPLNNSVYSNRSAQTKKNPLYSEVEQTHVSRGSRNHGSKLRNRVNEKHKETINGNRCLKDNR